MNKKLVPVLYRMGVGMGDDYDIINAQIESTRLGFDREVFAVAWLMLKYADGTGQGFGGSCLDDKATIGEKHGLLDRPGTAWGMEYIFSILRAVGVERWEDVRGKYVRVKYTGSTFDCDPFAIGHIVDDVWFDIRVLAGRHNLEYAPTDAQGDRDE